MSYTHLTIEERACIYRFLSLGMSIRSIAKVINRSASSISREIKRNATFTEAKKKEYFPIIANEKYKQRRLLCKPKRLFDQKAISYLKERLLENWSPEQIANRSTTKISHVPYTSTIYRLIHQRLIEKVTMKDLRRKGKFKNANDLRGRFNDGGRDILKRPKDVYRRQEIGHWEADTVESGRIDRKRKSKYCFVTIAERKSRYYIAVLVPDRTAKSVTPAIINALKQLPAELVITITFDRGKEFAGYLEIEEKLGCKTYFCDSYCAWQKGTNENINGLLREYYPKGMDLSEVTTYDLMDKLNRMNNRPRKCINYKTPNEVLFGNLH